MRRRGAHAALAVALGLFVAAGPAVAQSDFLKRGSDLLRGLQGDNGPASDASLSDGEIGAGLREALKVGVDTVTSQLGTTDGFNADPRVHIPLPDSLKTVQSALSRVGMSGMVDDLELRLNRAAEVAAPEAKAVFFDAIAEMSWDDVRRIYDGPEDAATRYLERTMTTPLVARMKPIVDASLAEAGAVQSYDRAIGQYRSLPFVPDVKADLTEHVLEGALHGIFLYLGEEEAAIRQNPAKRTTELLQKVFAR